MGHPCQRPRTLCSAQPPSHKPSEPLSFLDLSEHRLHQYTPLLVQRSASLCQQRALHPVPRAQSFWSDIPHIRLRVSKGPAILHDGDGRGIHERRQLSHRAHKTISRCRELASARQRRRLSARLHTLQLIQAHSSPLAILVTADDPKDTRYPGAGWSPPIRSSTCRNTSRGTAPSAS